MISNIFVAVCRLIDTTRGVVVAVLVGAMMVVVRDESRGTVQRFIFVRLRAATVVVSVAHPHLRDATIRDVATYPVLATGWGKRGKRCVRM